MSMNIPAPLVTVNVVNVFVVTILAVTVVEVMLLLVLVSLKGAADLLLKLFVNQGSTFKRNKLFLCN